jgi:hypothetical protein
LLSSRAQISSDVGGGISVERESDSADWNGKRDEESQLALRESWSTAGTRRESERETDVRVAGLLPRLTSPSRNNDDLVDIWFAIERQHRTIEWDQTFASVAEGWRPDPQHLSHFALFSYPSSTALIVARQVSPHPAAWQRVEAEARALVSRVNHVVAEHHAPSAPAGTSLRGRSASEASAARSWLQEATQALRGIVPKPQIPVSQSSSSVIR